MSLDWSSISEQVLSGKPRERPSASFRNILFPTDFSACSESALPYLRAIADRYGSTVHIMHAAGKESSIALRAINQITRSDVLEDVRCTRNLGQGEVLEAVLKMVADLRIDLIALGMHGRRGLRYVVLGSIAEQVFRHVTCPVLTVGPQVHNRGLAEGRIDRILYAKGFSAPSPRALDYARYIARTNCAELILLHAIVYLGESPLGDVAEIVGEVKTRLTNLIDKDEVDYQAVVGTGLSSEVILGAAEESKADLIIMSAHRGGFASAHTPWAIAHEVACRAPAPVLMVPS